MKQQAIVTAIAPTAAQPVIATLLGGGTISAMCGGVLPNVAEIVWVEETCPFSGAWVCWGTVSPSPPSLDDLSDATITSPVVNDRFVYDGTKWINHNGAGTSWAPTAQQGVGVTCSARVANYVRVGRFVFAWFLLDISSPGTAVNANPILVSRPVTGLDFTGGAGAIIPIGSAYCLMNSVQYPLLVVLNSGETSTVRFLRSDTTISNWWGADPAFDLDSVGAIVLNGHMFYEAAS